MFNTFENDEGSAVPTPKSQKDSAFTSAISEIEWDDCVLEDSQLPVWAKENKIDLAAAGWAFEIYRSGPLTGIFSCCLVGQLGQFIHISEVNGKREDSWMIDQDNDSETLI